MIIALVSFSTLTLSLKVVTSQVLPIAFLHTSFWFLAAVGAVCGLICPVFTFYSVGVVA